VSAYSYLIAPLGVLIAIQILHESFGMQHVVGGAVTILGVALARAPAARKESDNGS
jgi:drug/metabolite transporter (DMT)-like permease